MTSFFWITLGLFLSTTLGEADKYNSVNVFIGSGGPAYGYGGVNPAAQVPFGAMRIGPDTTLKAGDITFRHFSGYNYADDTIRAFSHTHLVGAGTNDLGNIGIMPFNLQNGSFDNARNFWWSTFHKNNESGSPGVYKVHLDEPNVDVELLALSNMAGIHKYTYHLNTPSLESPGLLVDVCHAAKLDKDSESLCSNASISIDPQDPSVFRAAVSFNGGFTKKMWMFLYGKLEYEESGASSAPWRLCSGKELKSMQCEDAGTEMQTSLGMLHATQLFNIDKKILKRGSFTAQLRVGLSFINSTMAQKNLEAALISGNSYESLKLDTQSLWASYLDKITVKSLEGDEELNAMLYSAVYRSFLSPTDYTETDGLYVGADKKVHNVTAERIETYGDAFIDQKQANDDHSLHFYSDLSFWDTFRTLHPWQLLLSEQLAVGVARSVGEISTQQQAFPRWILGSQEESCMIGLHGSAFILEAALAGLQSLFDITTIQKLLVQQSTQSVPLNGRTDVQFYMSDGYVSQDSAEDSAALTLTFAFDDFVLGGISNLVNDSTAAQAAYDRSRNYRNIWSSEKQYFCGRYKSGELLCPDTPTDVESWELYREGDALHWLYFVPQDVPGLIQLFPSVEDFDQSLSFFMDQHVAYQEKFGSALPNPYYWAGNEHNHLSPYLFNFESNCTKTQYWARRLTEMHFSNTAHGDPGNEDYGAMSTWLLFSSLGFYPLAGTTTFLLGSPRISSASLRFSRWGRAEESVLRIVAHNNSQSNLYVERVLLNGEPLKSPFIKRDQLVAQSEVTLEFFMHSEATSTLCM